MYITENIIKMLRMVCLVSIAMSVFTPTVHADEESEDNVQTPIVMLNPSSQEGRVPVIENASVMRQRMVSLNVAGIKSIDANGSGLTQFHLFDDVIIDAEFQTRIKVSDKHSALGGTLSGEVEGTIVLVYEDNVLAANIRTTDGMYQIRHVSDALYSVHLIDSDAFPPCGTTHDHIVSQPATPLDEIEVKEENLDGASLATAAAATIRVMVVYTDLVRQAVGSTSAVNSLISLSVAETNQAYANSGVAQRLSLVHRQEIVYVEPGNIGTALDELTDPSLGKLAAVRDLRSIYGADLVSLLIEQTSYCGLAWVPRTLVPSNEVVGYSVVRQDCAAGPAWSFAHELAHNMSCTHDRDNADPDFPPLNSYAYGHRFYGGGGLQWRTIMSYAPGSRIQYFSNPNIFYDGKATGVDIGEATEAYNARTLDNTANNVAGYRNYVPGIKWLDFGYGGTQTGAFNTPYSSLSNALSNVVSGGTVAIKGGSLSGAQTLMTPAVLDAFESTVILGN